METKQQYVVEKESLVKQIDNLIAEKGFEQVNNIRFDLDKCVDINQYKILSALKKVFISPMTCDLDITEEFLEKAQNYIYAVQ